MRKFMLMLFFIIFCLGLCGCKSKVQAQYEELQEEYDDIKSDYDKLKTKYNDLKDDYDSLKKNYDNLNDEYNAYKSGNTRSSGNEEIKETYKNSQTGYNVIICDMADLFSDLDEEELTDYMSGITKYGNVGIATIDVNSN